MTGAGNWTYFLPGRHPVLIDAGTGESAHITDVANARAEGPAHVVVTHAHSDHIAGGPTIATRWPETVFSKYPWPERDAKYDVAWQPLKDDDIVLAGDDELQVVHTPGHAPDHIALWHRRSKTLFSGDLVVPGTTVVILATHGGSLAQYLASLMRVEALAPARLLPAHGEPIDDPVAIIRRYIAHRLEREGQILAALAAGLRNVDAIVERIYVGLSAPLAAMARESVLAHLIKLQDEARVTREGEEWRIG